MRLESLAPIRVSCTRAEPSEAWRVSEWPPAARSRPAPSGASARATARGRARRDFSYHEEGLGGIYVPCSERQHNKTAIAATYGSVRRSEKIVIWKQRQGAKKENNRPERQRVLNREILITAPNAKGVSKRGIQRPASLDTLIGRSFDAKRYCWMHGARAY
jgi:hypothetical protein